MNEVNQFKPICQKWALDSKVERSELLALDISDSIDHLSRQILKYPLTLHLKYPLLLKKATTLDTAKQWVQFSFVFTTKTKVTQIFLKSQDYPNKEEVERGFLNPDSIFSIKPEKIQSWLDDSKKFLINVRDEPINQNSEKWKAFFKQLEGLINPIIDKIKLYKGIAFEKNQTLDLTNSSLLASGTTEKKRADLIKYFSFLDEALTVYANKFSYTYVGGFNQIKDDFKNLNCTAEEARTYLDQIQEISNKHIKTISTMKNLFFLAAKGSLTYVDFLTQNHLPKKRDLSQSEFTQQRLSQYAEGLVYMRLIGHSSRLLDHYFSASVNDYESFSQQYDSIKLGLTSINSATTTSIPNGTAFRKVDSQLKKYNQEFLEAIYRLLPKNDFKDIQKSLDNISGAFNLKAQAELKKLLPCLMLLETKGLAAFKKMKEKLLTTYEVELRKLDLVTLRDEKESFVNDHKKAAISMLGDSIRMISLLRNLRLYLITDSKGFDRAGSNEMLPNEFIEILVLDELESLISAVTKRVRTAQKKKRARANKQTKAINKQAPSQAPEKEECVTPPLDLEMDSEVKELPKFQFQTQSLKTKVLVKELVEAGFIPKSKKGSHIKFQNDNGISVVVPAKAETRKGTKKSIEEQAGQSQKSKDDG